MGCVEVDSWLWPYLAGIATAVVCLWILALGKITNFSGVSARHAHFAQLSNTPTVSNELPRNCLPLQRYPHGHESKDERLHYEATEPLRRSACLSGSTSSHAARGSRSSVRSNKATGRFAAERLPGTSSEESGDAQRALQNPEPCTKYTP